MGWSQCRGRGGAALDVLGQPSIEKIRRPSALCGTTGVIADPSVLRTLRQAAAFDRMAAIQLRRIAVIEPHLADRLRHIANQLEADAADMERHLSGN